MDFQCALYQQLVATPNLHPDMARLRNEIEDAPLGATLPKVAMIESHVRLKMGLDLNDTIDWSILPTGWTWAMVFQFLVKLFTFLAPFLALL